MFVGDSSPLPLKRRRHAIVDSMEAEAANATITAIREKFGRDLRVFETTVLSASSSQVSNDDEPDDLEFTAADFYRITAKKKDDNFLKTRKIREAEQAARRSRITKTTMRVRFPDNVTLETTFHPSEKIQDLMDLLSKVIAHPELPFYIYTVPPKKKVKDFSQDFFSAGFVPGAIVYFSYEKPQGDESEAPNSSPYLLEEIISLKGLDCVSQPTDPVQSEPEPAVAAPPPIPQQPKSADKKPAKPKWFKL